MMNKHILDRLYEILQQRKDADGGGSYVASLYEGGSAKIAEKILEEAQEVIDEALALERCAEETDGNAAGTGRSALQKNIRAEAADLLFHLMVMLAHHDVPPEEVFKVLEGRFGTSGHDEKASRGE